MAELVFNDPPSVELLQWLARGSLKQNLPRAIRLWSWLQFLYSEEKAKTRLPNPFTYADWRDAFFTSTHPQGEAVPRVHDPHCPCAISTADWLFAVTTGLVQSSWIKSLKQHDSLPENLSEILKSRLFGVTRRTLYEDLRILHKLGWVKRRDQKYYLVEDLPNRPSPVITGGSSVIVQPDLAAIADNLSQEINGYQRFFLHVEYVVPRNLIDQVDDWQNQLRALWQQVPVPPVLLTYYSAKLGQVVQSIVYPVCIYYVQRATYLCAWGETPDGESGAMDWRNYRLDRIQQVTDLTWRDRRIPKLLRQAYQQGQLPTPDYIQEQMSEAWGFDFYRPATLLLMRFDHWFYEGYIRGTVRHETFQQVSYAQAKQLIHQQTSDRSQRQALLKIWKSRSPEDAYYQAQYREGDPNVMLRLRAWRPKMEVLLPWHLRQTVAAEVERERQLYQD